MRMCSHIRPPSPPSAQRIQAVLLLAVPQRKPETSMAAWSILDDCRAHNRSSSTLTARSQGRTHASPRRQHPPHATMQNVLEENVPKQGLKRKPVATAPRRLSGGCGRRPRPRRSSGSFWKILKGSDALPPPSSRTASASTRHLASASTGAAAAAAATRERSAWGER
jgi:hypothetical protein